MDFFRDRAVTFDFGSSAVLLGPVFEPQSPPTPP
jgi:hypothetical protein